MEQHAKLQEEFRQNNKKLPSKGFQRHVNFWSMRLGDGQDMSIADKAYEEYLTRKRSGEIGCSDQLSQWSFLGPTTISNTGFDSRKRGIGRVTHIRFDPNNPDIMYVGTAHGGVWKSTNAGLSWTDLYSSQLDVISVQDIAIKSDGTVFIATGDADIVPSTTFASSDGVWKLAPGSTEWVRMNWDIKITDKLRISRLLINPNNENIMLAAVHAAPHSGSFGVIPNPQGYELDEYSNSGVPGSKAGGIYRSVNGGEDWVKVRAGYFRDMEFAPGDPSTVYACGWNLYKSSNSGAGWTNITDLTNLPDHLDKDEDAHLNCMKLAVSKANPGCIYVAISKHVDFHAIWYSSDYGVSFEKRAWETNVQGSPSPYDPINNIFYGGIWSGHSRMDIDVDPFNDQTVYIGSGQVQASVDGGKRFRAYFPVHDDIHGIYAHPTLAGVVYAATDGGVFRNDQYAYGPWEMRNEGLQVSQIHNLAVSPHGDGEVLIGTQDNGTSRMDQQGTWAGYRSGGDGFACEFHPDDPELTVVTMNNRVLLVDRDGEIADPFFASPPNTRSSFTNSNFVFSPCTADEIFGVFVNSSTRRRELYYTASGGIPWTTWQQLTFSDVDFPSSNIEKVFVDPNNCDHVYVTCSGGNDNENTGLASGKLLFSSDKGGTWTDITPTAMPLYAGGVTKVEFKPGSSKAWLTLASYDKTNVLVSNDPSDPGSWSDFSQHGQGDLPKLACIDIVYHRGRLYLATDVGVYERAEDATHWSCFSKNLTTARVTQLKVGKCDGKLYASTFGRGVWCTALPASSINITSNTTWSGAMTVETDVYVKPGNTLTINGTVSMQDARKIVVEQGAQLIVDGGKITSICQEWKGVEVWGDRTKTQLVIGGVQHQGKLTMINGGRIENARTGATNWKPGDWNTTGGIIQTNMASFLNCWRAVEFMSYQNFLPINGASVFDQSYFKRTTFKQTDESDFYAFVSLWDVNGINFTSCVFENTNTGLAPEDLGHGIDAADSYFTVNSTCGVVTTPGAACPDQHLSPTVFKNLHHGIWAKTTVTNRTFYVNQVKFENNIYGVKAEEVDGVYLVYSDFTIGGNLNITGGFQEGLVLQGGTGYKVEENTFESNVILASSPIGIRVSNTGVPNNQIYKNWFNNLMYACLSNYQNKHPVSPWSGLQFICNENSGNVFDFSVTNDGQGSGIRPYQGYHTTPAGNTFSYMTIPNGGDFLNNGGGWMNYYYSISSVNQTPYDYEDITPVASTYVNSCASRLSQATSRKATKEAYLTRKAELSTLLKKQHPTLLEMSEIAALSTDLYAEWFRLYREQKEAGELTYRWVEQLEEAGPWMLYDQLVEDGAYEQAQDQLNRILKKENTESNIEIAQLKALMLRVMMSPDKLKLITPEDLTFLRETATKEGKEKPQILARNILALVARDYHQNLPNLPEESTLEVTTDFDHVEELTFSVYPNPAKHELTVEGSLNTQIEWYNAQGQLVHTSSGNGTLDVSLWSPGVYTCRLINGHKTLVHKVVIEH